MGLFDSLYTSLRCPATGLEREVEIQFKFGEPFQQQYHIGDQLDVGPYGNLWIPEDYLCGQCTTYKEPEQGGVGRQIEKFVAHPTYIHLEQGKFLEVLTGEEFELRYGINGERLPGKEVVWKPYFKYDSEKKV